MKSIDNPMFFPVVSMVIAFIVTAVATKCLIPYLKKNQFGQYIREEGPKAHLSKAGTPTMGGLAIVLGVTVGVLISGHISTDKIVILLSMYAFGLIGFIDDYNKIAKKENEGLTPKQKILIQVAFGAAIAIYMMLTSGTQVYIPFFKVYIDFGWLYIPFIIFVEVAMANAVNLTDGLDGLASSVTISATLPFAWLGVSVAAGFANDSMTAGAMALIGALFGFLVFNHYPAKIFMGDTGSMALGGCLTAVAIVGHLEFLLPITGMIFVIEALSVILQVTYFKKTGGKRLFRMAPIHHHFELGGLKETQVVFRFSMFTILCSIIAILAV